MDGFDHPQGTIDISRRAIATIAYQAAQQSYGVVGMAAKNLANGLAQMLLKDPTKGVEVKFYNRQINIDLYIVIEYGTRISTVASSVAHSVRFNVERTLGLPVNEVNVHVQGLRVSTID
jgi:uncharacterized alkaline shock family protein YloU